MNSYQSIDIPTNDIRLHTVTAGPQDGKPVILLHGFPEFWYSWRKQIGPLAEAGYRVIVPDQRGYNLSDKPSGIGYYQLDILVEDIIGLLDYFEIDKAAVVGHDWGAAVAWTLAIQYANRVDRLAILNVPHPGIKLSALARIPQQLIKSWYILFFQIPFLPEYLLSRKNYTALCESLIRSSSTGAFTPQDLEIYRQAWSQPNAVASMLNWYRAMMQMPPAGLSGARINLPVRIIWGMRDIALHPKLAAYSIELCDHGDLFYLENATHWVHQDQPDEVNRLIIDFLTKNLENGSK